MKNDRFRGLRADESFRRLNDGVEAMLFPDQKSPGVNRLRRGITSEIKRMFDLEDQKPLGDDVSELTPQQEQWRATNLRIAIRQAVKKTTGETLPRHRGDAKSDAIYAIALGRAKTYLLN